MNKDVIQKIHFLIAFIRNAETFSSKYRTFSIQIWRPSRVASSESINSYSVDFVFVVGFWDPFRGGNQHKIDLSKCHNLLVKIQQENLYLQGKK